MVKLRIVLGLLEAAAVRFYHLAIIVHGQTFTPRSSTNRRNELLQ